MLKAQHKINEGVILKDGTTGIIQSPFKDFSNQTVCYRLKDGRKISESQIESVVTFSPRDPRDELKMPTSAEIALGMATTPEEALKAPSEPSTGKGKGTGKESVKESVLPEATVSTDNSAKVAAIDALTHEELITLITDRELDLDADDYGTREELASAICEELDLV